MLEAVAGSALLTGELSGIARRQAAVVGGAEYVMFDWIPERGTRLHLVPLASFYSSFFSACSCTKCVRIMPETNHICTHTHIYIAMYMLTRCHQSTHGVFRCPWPAALSRRLMCQRTLPSTISTRLRLRTGEAYALVRPVHRNSWECAMPVTVLFSGLLRCAR